MRSTWKTIGVAFLAVPFFASNAFAFGCNYGQTAEASDLKMVAEAKSDSQAKPLVSTPAAEVEVTLSVPEKPLKVIANDG